MRRVLIASLALGGASLAAPPAAEAGAMSRAQIAKAMIGRTITLRRFGLPVRMLYRGDGTVTARAALGTVNGTWRYGDGDKVCTTFPSGPAKGTDCVTFSDLGDGRFRSSAGVTFKVR